MKTVTHYLYGKPCVVSPAIPPKPGKWLCIACPVCGIAVEADSDTVFGTVVLPVHDVCYESAVDLDAETELM
jgi:hypothetical protein